ncbi:AAA family ATPase [Enterococcus sp. AZ180]|uniref:AAA family ATPase n=1 Tax=Enterococcus sp. AZ180 TaxID=2774961 RepID=UPI003F226456
MKIDKISIVNWKAFANKEFTFDEANIISWENGTGKTSLFEAILFGLYGKRPNGFSYSTLKQNPSEETSVTVHFSFADADGNERNVKIKRSFYRNAFVVIEENGETVTQSMNEAYAFMDAILPYDIIKIFWASNSLQSSEILRTDYLTNTVLEHIFKEPKLIEAKLKASMFAQSKVVKGLVPKVPDAKDRIKEAKKHAADIQSKLKEKVTGNLPLADANIAKSAKEELDALVDSSEFGEDDVIDKDSCRLYSETARRNIGDKVAALEIEINGLKDYNEGTKEEISKIEADIAKELEKDASFLNKMDNRILEPILTHSVEHGHCAICEEKWNDEKTARIEKSFEGSPNESYVNSLRSKINSILSKVSSNESKILMNESSIESLKEESAILDKFSKEAVNFSINYHNLSTRINKCPNYEEVINSYNEENDNLWAEFDKVNASIQSLAVEVDNNEKYKVELAAYNEMSDKIGVVREYVVEANEYYSRSITNISSEILESLNPRYSQVFIEEGAYYVTIMDKNLGSVNILPVFALSSGERTLVALSMIMAVHKLFFHESPLLFDEALNALDRENLGEVKKMLMEQDMQKFIITHDQFWMEEQNENSNSFR